MDKKKLLIFIIFFIGFIIINIANVAATSDQLPTAKNISNIQVGQKSNVISHIETTNSSKAIAIKVLIYNGKNADEDCVEGIKTVLDLANSKRLVSRYYFTYKTSSLITSSVLRSYNVLIMPGGDDYISDSGRTIGSINPSAIKNFVANGNGYIGICAGAYSGARYTEDWYYGWGVAPHVFCRGIDYVSRLNIQITPSGQQIFGYGGIKTTLHWNGPAMYPRGGNILTFAKYADNIMGSKGMGAIVGDFYGKGRSVLIGPHPELDPQLPDIMAHLVAWVANPTRNGFRVTSTSPMNLLTNIGRKSSIIIKFSNNLRPSTYINNITVKNLKTQKTIKIAKLITKNILAIRTETRSIYTWFQVFIPAKAVKDILGNYLLTNYIFKFKTGS